MRLYQCLRIFESTKNLNNLLTYRAYKRDNVILTKKKLFLFVFGLVHLKVNNFCFIETIELTIFKVQIIMGLWGMPWRQKPKKGVASLR